MLYDDFRYKYVYFCQFLEKNAWRFAEGDVFFEKISYYSEKLSFLEKSKEKLGKAT
jgi:hypothetical protein